MKNVGAAAIGKFVGRPEAPVCGIVGYFAPLARFEAGIGGRRKKLALLIEGGGFATPTGEAPVHVWIVIFAGPRLDKNPGTWVLTPPPAQLPPDRWLAQIDEIPYAGGLEAWPT